MDSVLRVPSASSQALPAPKPSPTHAGHALRLNKRTEKTTPNERPREERIRKDDIAWSHCDTPRETQPVLRNILLLDKSTSPLSAQIDEACEILGIKLPFRGDEPKTYDESYNHYGPREEWTMRWLLKKLEGAESEIQSIYVEPKVWLMFHELIRCFPVATLAHLLRTHGFVKILSNTMKTLGDILEKQKHGSAPSTNGASSETSNVADSSSATVGAAVKSPTTLRKRKHDGTLVHQNGTIMPYDVDVESIYDEITRVLSELLALQTKDSHGYACEHLKMAMRPTSKEAAQMLGTSVAIANCFIHNRPVAGKRKYMGSPHSSVHHWLDVWASRSSRAPNTGAEDGLVHICKTDDTVSILERLLLQQVALPIRQSFERSRSGARKSEEASEVNIDELLAPLGKNHVREGQSEHSKHGKMHPIAQIYAIILKHTPLATPKQRLSEKAWLQFLFDRLVAQASILDVELSDTSLAPDPIRALKDILEMLADHKVKLELSALENLLEQRSHIFDDNEGAQVDWELVGLCLKIDPDVFVIPAVSRDRADRTIREPNKYLNAVFKRINAATQPSEVMPEKIRRRVEEAILVPLVNAFAQARNLVGFIDIWRSNLVQFQGILGPPTPFSVEYTDGSGRNLCVNGDFNLWQSERLLRAVADQVELRLTVGQTRTVLQSLEIGPSTTDEASMSKQSRGTAADLLILDCILSGCKNEDTVEQLSETARNLYTTLLRSCVNDTLHTKEPWRIWRCLATIKSRWAREMSLALDFQALEEKIKSKALEHILSFGQGHSVDELLQSLNFLLSFIDCLGSPSRHEVACSVMHAVMTAIEYYTQQVQLEPCEHDDVVISLQSTTRTVDMQHLVRNYISQLCFRPTALRAATPELQKRFFNSLFTCGLQDYRPDESASKELDSEPGLWQDFLHSTVLEEDLILAKVFREFLTHSFLHGPGSTGSDRAYALIFDSIHKTPVRAFDRRQRAEIFNCVLGNLHHAPFLTMRLRKDHVKLCITHFANPNKSFNLLQHPSGLHNALWEAGHPTPALIKIAQSWDQRPDLDSEAVKLLRRFTWVVLECQLLRDDETQIASYLKGWYNDLHEALDRISFCESLPSLVMVAASLDFYQTHGHKFPMELRHGRGETPLFRRTLLESMCKATHRMAAHMFAPETSEHVVYAAGVLVSSMASYTDIFREWESQVYQRESATKRALEAMRTAQGNSEPSKAVNLLANYLTPGSRATLSQQRQHVSSVIATSESLDLDEKANVMTGLMDQAAESLPDRQSLLLLQGLIAPKTSANSQNQEHFSTALSQVFNHLSDELLQPQSFDISMLSLQIIDTILRKHSRSITQYHIDQTLSVITTSASLTRPGAPTAHTPKQIPHHYLALNRLLSSTLSFHRTRLGGRSHLLLVALQSLLRPLFIPYLPTSNPRDFPPYTGTHAAAYSRLLLQVADPSLPSLLPSHRFRNKQHHHLTDATKTAKTVAGRWMHYLVMTYCECQLKGRLEKAVREKLKPGLWAALDVIPQEVMRVMNVSLGKEGRGVWKGLYAEWRRERGGTAGAGAGGGR
ncbi:MAG: hypothetical protein Q9184_003574 [Pyrenodesmia sp. 2 TL-2023]